MSETVKDLKKPRGYYDFRVVALGQILGDDLDWRPAIALAREHSAAGAVVKGYAGDGEWCELWRKGAIVADPTIDL